MKRRLFIPAIAALFILAHPPASVAGGPAAHNQIDASPLPVETREIPRIRDVSVIHFVLDGLNKRAFDRALSDGELPNVQRYLVEHGARFTHALSNFPSTSSTVYQSYVTGLLPGHAGIPHLERLDRQTEEVIGYLSTRGPRLVNADLFNLRALMNPDVAEIEPPTTIFELLRGHPTAAVYAFFSRGASSAHPARAPIHALWSTYVTQMEQKVDVLAFRDVLRRFKGDEIPRYTLVGLYSADIAGHHFGPESPQVADVLKQFDLFLGEFFDLLAERGIAEKSYVIVSADHGMHESGELFAFRKALEEKGIAVKPSNPRDRNYTLYAANRGVVSSHIYVRHKTGETRAADGFAPIDDPGILKKHPTTDGGTVDLEKLILSMEATDLLIVRAGEHRARVMSRDGKRADIACFSIDATEYCSYRFDRAAGDPLGLSANPRLAHLLDGRPHSTLAWRQVTADERYPDAVIQLSQIFHDGRAGDAFITTRGRFGFRKVKAGNHGGPAEDDMRVPLLMAGPTVPHGTFGIARSVDLFPLLVEWFGLDVPRENYDGVDPFVGAAGEDGPQQKLAALEELFEENPSLLRMIDVPGFVRRDVAAIVRPAEFGRLLPLAREESARRARTLGKLRTLLQAMEAQATREDAPQVVPPAYLTDHSAIVARTKAWLEASLLRMEDIVTVLEKCRNPNADACRNL